MLFCETSFFSWITKLSKRKSFLNFINETNIEIPESMIVKNTLVIKESNPDCRQFLDVIKETNYQINTPNIESAEIELISYNDYKNILNLLHHLNIEKIISFSKIKLDDILDEDLSKLCKMATEENISTIILMRTRTSYSQNFTLKCTFRRLFITCSEGEAPMDNQRVNLIPQDLMEITENFYYIGFDFDLHSSFEEEIGRITRYAIAHKKLIEVRS